jgi:hypothetical protein
MEPEAQNVFQQAWKEAPSKVRDAILAQTHREVIQKATKNVNLDAEDVASLEQEVLFVLLGIQTIREFEDEISLRSTLTTEQSQDFIKKIHEELFARLLPQSHGMENKSHTPVAEETARGTAITVHTAIDAYGLVRERLERLPQSVQATIRSEEMERGLASLLGKYQFKAEHAPVFVAEAVRVMVGLTTTNNFKTEVTRTTGLNPNTLDALFFDAESTLFKPVRMAIMQALEQRGSIPQTNAPLTSVRATDPYREPIQ